jgi:hypothetical protein
MGSALAAIAAFFFVLAIVYLLFAAWRLHAAAGGRAAGGACGGASGRPRRGPDSARSPHLVVDTLNLAHWLHRDGALPITTALIIETIDRTAPILRRRHEGRIMYVLKDQESRFNDEEARLAYKQAADRNKVYVLVAERYPDPPKGATLSAEHSARGRDDFFMSVMAHRWRCAVLTEDRLRDFEEFRATILPFQVYEFAFWRARPYRDFIRPDSPAYARIKRPHLVRYAEYFPDGL